MEILNFLEKCEQEQRIKSAPPSILPNDLIMRIIQEGDGGLHEHKKKWCKVVENINRAREWVDEFREEQEEEDYYAECWLTADQPPTELFDMSPFYQFCWANSADQYSYYNRHRRGSIYFRYDMTDGLDMNTYTEEDGYDLIDCDSGGVWCYNDFIMTFKEAQEELPSVEQTKTMFREWCDL